MLELVSSGLLSLWLESSGADLQPLRALAPPPDTWGITVPMTDLDLTIQIDRYLKVLEQEQMSRDNQGIWLQSDVLAIGAHDGTTPRIPASLTKVATTLAVLEQLPADWSAVMTVAVQGEVRKGTLYGQLVIAGEPDPLFVYEEAIALGNALNQAGIYRIEGEIVIDTALMLENETDPVKIAAMLAQTWQPRDWDEDLAAAYRRLPKGTPQPTIRIRSPGVTRTATGAVSEQRVRADRDTRSGSRQADDSPENQTDAQIEPQAENQTNNQAENQANSSTDAVTDTSIERLAAPERQRLSASASKKRSPANLAARGKTNRLGAPIVIVEHRSLNTIGLLKQMNVHSDNTLAEYLAEKAGGAKRVAEIAQRLTHLPKNEIQLFDGSGLSRENRLSPRAVCSLFTTIQRRLWQMGLTVGDVFPMKGLDDGTVEERTMPEGSTVKTGTLWDVNGLAGALPTRDRGVVWFAVMNSGENHTLEFRKHQDEFLKALQKQWGAAPTPPELLPRDRDPALRPGAADRNRIVRSVDDL